MGVQITVFVDQPNTDKQTNIISKLQKYPILVDAIHKNNPTFLKENYKTNAYFFFVSEFLSRCNPVDLSFSPDIAVTLDTEVEEYDWICVERYLESLIFTDLEMNYDPDILEKGKVLLEKYSSPAPLQVPPVPPPQPEVQYYDMLTHHVKDRDVMLVQIEKPYCDLPYTVVIREFSRKGFKSVFTDLFICSSWGVARKDYEFLSQLWKHWFGDEPYNLDQMLREATERCFPDKNQNPEPEPEVFRRPIENVLETFKQREEGKQTSNLDIWNEQRLKKRKLDDQFLLNKSL